MSNRENTILDLTFWLLCLAGLIPILSVKYIPSVDLPNHILAAALHAGELSNVEHNVLTSQWVLSPYMLFHFMMYPFIKLFGYMAASKIVLGAYAVLMPVSVRMFAKEIATDYKYLAFFAFPFIFTYHFDYGFIPYVVGIPLVFIGLAVASRALKKGMPAGYILLMSILTLAIYFGHFVNFAAYSIGLIVLMLSQRRNVHGSYAQRRFPYFTMLIRILVTYLPAIICIVAYSGHFVTGEAGAGKILSLTEYQALFHQLTGLARVVLSLDGWVDFAELAAMLGFGLVCLVSKGSRLNRGFPLYYGILMLLLTVLTPREHLLGGSDFSTRLAIFGIISLLLALTQTRVSVKRVAAFIMVILFIAGLIVRTNHYVRYDRLSESYVHTINDTALPGSNICTIYNAFPESRIPIMLHDIAYHHIESGGFSPFLFADLPHVAGISSSIDIPRLSENWNPRDTLRMAGILTQYDYLVVLTYGSALPEAIERICPDIVCSDSICTILRPGSCKPGSDQ